MYSSPKIWVSGAYTCIPLLGFMFTFTTHWKGNGEKLRLPQNSIGRKNSGRGIVFEIDDHDPQSSTSSHAETIYFFFSFRRILSWCVVSPRRSPIWAVWVCRISIPLHNASNGEPADRMSPQTHQTHLHRSFPFPRIRRSRAGVAFFCPDVQDGSVAGLDQIFSLAKGGA